MAEGYAFQKLETNVEIILSGGARRQGSIWLSRQSREHSGAQSPGEVLNAERAFLPFKAHGGETVLLNRDLIETLTVTAAELERQGTTCGELTLGVTRVPVRLMLAGGDEAHGELVLDIPRPPEPRVQDVLNTGQAFIALVREGAVTYVNRRRILIAVETGSPIRAVPADAPAVTAAPLDMETALGRTRAESVPSAPLEPPDSASAIVPFPQATESSGGDDDV